jgi:hypothetical protein
MCVRKEVTRPVGFMDRDEELLTIMVCSFCKADVKLEEQKIACSKCGRKYSVRDGIPIMLINKAERNEDG